MLTTCFLAALLHGIVILGVTFSSPRGDADATATAPPWKSSWSTTRRRASRRIPNARYLSAAHPARLRQHLEATSAALIPKSSLMPVDTGGHSERRGSGGRSSRRARPAMRNSWRRTCPRRRSCTSRRRAPPTSPPQLPLLLEKRPDLGMAPNDDGVELRMRGEAKQQLWIAADTRESDVAVYLDSWRRKIERVGTMNFPGCRAAPEALRNAGDRGDDRRRRQAPASRDPPQQRPRRDRRGRHANLEACRALRPVSERTLARSTIRSASPTSGSSWVVRTRAPAYFIRTQQPWRYPVNRH